MKLFSASSMMVLASPLAEVDLKKPVADNCMYFVAFAVGHVVLRRASACCDMFVSSIAGSVGSVWSMRPGLR